MRKHFAAYVLPGPDEFAKLHGGIISLDTNVLLNLYRYSPETRDEFLALLEKLQPQLWLTHQAATEFHRNRLRVIAQQLGMLAEARGKLQAAKADLDPKLIAVYRAPSSQSKARLAKLSGAWTALETYINDLEKEAVKPTSDPADDRVWSRLAELFDDRVGGPYTAEERQRHEAEGKERYSRRIPPGYADADKGGTAFGDWLIWRQLLDHAKSAAMPVVLVTDDRKDDWWLSAGNRPVAPRPELIDEMAAEAGQPFYMYQPDQFLKDVGKAVKQVASGRAIEEVASLPPITTSGPRYLRVRSARELEDLRHRTAALRRDLAVITEAVDSVPSHSAGQRRPRLRKMQAEVMAQLEAAERQEHQILRSDQLRAYLGTGQIVQNAESAVLAPGSPFDFTSSDQPLVLSGEYNLNLADIDGLLPGSAFDVTYPMIDHHGSEWVRHFDVGTHNSAPGEPDLPGTSDPEDEPPTT